VLTELWVISTHATQINNAPNAGRLGRLAEVFGIAHFLGDPVVTVTDAVDEIDRNVNAQHCLGGHGADLTFDNLNTISPRDVTELPRAAYEAPDLVTLFEKSRDESPADVASSTSDEDVTH